jgi:predicted dehydrogenase
MSAQPGRLHLGMLGAARIGNWGVVQPSRHVDGVVLHAVAARDRARGEAYAKKHKIAKVHRSYDELLADPEIDAVYNPLPNSLHCEWTIKALAKGKHVLCEKPFASNRDEAVRMAEAARRHGRVLMEAFHYRFHPLAERLRATVARLGRVERIETNMCVPLFAPNDIRFRYELGGGATMDVGAYTVNLLRLLGASVADGSCATLPEVRSATPLLKSEKIDRAMKIELAWPNGTVGRIHHSLWSSSLLNMSAHVIGERGELHVINPYLPHIWHRLTTIVDGERRRERVVGETTYTHQLREFAARIRRGAPWASDLTDSIDNMQTIDAIYDKAGLPRRGMPDVQSRL